jgi:tetratricopeptide (TPR) repeat protein
MSDEPQSETTDAISEARLKAFEAEAGEVFPALSGPQPSDDALAKRLAASAIVAAPAAVAAAGSSSASGISGTKLIVGLLGGVLVVAAGAALIAPKGHRSAPLERRAAPAIHLDPTAAEAPPEEAIEPAPIPPTVVEQPTERPVKSPPPAAAIEQPRVKQPSAAVSETSAAEMLARANARRRGGDHQAAVEIYGALGKQFPNTREDLIARVSMARLELERLQRPADALEHFDSYLKDKPRGNLAEEATYGRAKALSQLGRPSEAEAWERLLGAFPESPHAGEAKRRLAALGQ